MTTAIVVSHLDGREFLRQLITESFGSDWSSVAEATAREYDCLPDDVGCDECSEGGDDLVTINGEAVARLSFVVDSKRKV